MKSRARWAATARDLTNYPGEVAQHLTVGQLSDATNLSRKYLLDALTREAITKTDNPRSALCRPAAQFGGEPLWSPKQLQEYLDILAQPEASELPLVDPAEADERGLVASVELAELFGRHDQTFRRAQATDGSYPVAVARRSRGGRPGVPEHVRSLLAVAAWAHGKGIDVPVEVRERIGAEAWQGIVAQEAVNA